MLFQCVPNISEGRDASFIDFLKQKIIAIPGAFLLDVDPGYSAKRSVFTIVGNAQAVMSSAICIVEHSLTHINIFNYQSSHPCVGAVDVIPFIALNPACADEAIEISKLCASEISSRFNIPCFLYGDSTKSIESKELSFIRKGGVRALSERMYRGEVEPYTGPHGTHPTFGAICIGARPILVAYNVNLSTKDLRVGKQVAKKIRELRTSNQHAAYLRAIAWEAPEFDCVQISLNLLDYKKCSVKDAFLLVRSVGKEIGVEVNGSELVGMLPLGALVSEAEAREVFDLQQMSSVERVVAEVGLSKVKPFSKEKILDVALKELGMVSAPL